jgi:preprotein translocase subunit SecA
MESFDMFERMTTNIREDTVKYMLTLRVRTQAETERRQVAKVTHTSGSQPGAGAGGDGTEKGRTVRKGRKVGPNDLCPCGSGKKYKNCCGDVRKN